VALGQSDAQRLAAIVESSADAILSVDLDGIIATWNRGAEKLLGYTGDEVIGKPVTMLIPVNRQGEEPAILERIGRGERIQEFETERLRKDGSPVAVSLSVSPIMDAGGTIIGASKIGRDITERKRAVSIRAHDTLTRPVWRPCDLRPDTHRS
jgi:PAS domain S-box-containing protein